MDRRSWLWRRKSSEKSPNETESTGSASSHSERFSDDQVYPTHSSQSPETMSKAAPIDEDLNNSVKTLTEKLSAALRDITTKEELAKQHAKVAEEAVSGWEKAENEVLALRKQVEAAAKKNSALEDRVSHLDGALKECVRQLRQAREDQELKIHEAVSKKEFEWQSTKEDLQSQLAELRVQLPSAKSAASADYNLRSKLEEMEKKNAALNCELLARAEEVEMRILERDLSTQAAEAASKQHLESIKKVAKLEAECRRLKSITRKASPPNYVKSAIVSFTKESSTDSQSENCDKQQAVDFEDEKMRGLDVNENMKSSSDSLTSSHTTGHNQLIIQKAIGGNAIVPLTDINLLDDFLEMERLAGLPDTSRSFCFEKLPLSNHVSGAGKNVNSGLEAMTQKIAQLEKELKRTEAEKAELGNALIECQEQLQTSQCQLEEAVVKLAEFETEITAANESRKTAEKEVKAINSEKEVMESRLRAAEAEIKELLSKIGSLQKEAENERALSVENVHKCKKLEEELLTSNIRLNDAEAYLLELQTRLVHIEDLNQIAEKEVKAVDARRELAESQLKDSEAEIQTSVSKIGSLENEVEKERAISARCIEKCQRLEGELEASQSCLKQVENKFGKLEYQLTLANEFKEISKKEGQDAIAALKMLQSQLVTSQSRLEEVENKLAELDHQLTLANESKEVSKKEAEDAAALIKMLQSQLRKAEDETETMTLKIHSLEEMVEKERALSAEYVKRCQKLEHELLTVKEKSEFRQYSELHHVASTNGDIKIRKEKEFAEAADKLAECQKTIASLGQQLNSLVTLDDLLNDVDESADLNCRELQFLQNDREPWKLSSSYFQQRTSTVID